MQFYTLFPNFAERAGIAGRTKRKRMENRVDRIVDVVGSHHNVQKTIELGFETLFEADLIVDLFEGYYPAEEAGACYRNGVRIASGKSWFARLFPGCAGVG